MSEQGEPEFLRDALKFGIKPGLERITRLCELLGNPQNSFRAVHIAGTNGKGSITAYTSTILACADLRVGVFTSPFLERFSERIRVIDGRDGLEALEKNEAAGEISSDDLARLSGMTERAAAEMLSEGMENPTEFELITAICFLYFAECKVDLAVLEVGLGGRLDSTNVISNPVATAIAAMGYDHCDRLGSTMTEITGEKAGILKPGAPCVCLNPDLMLIGDKEREEVRSVVRTRAERLGCRLYTAGNIESMRSAKFTGDGRMIFDNCGTEYNTCLNGRHQVGNAAVAIALAELCGISRQFINEGISRTVWKCRAEIICKDPVVLLDGGHNPQGAAALAGVVNEIMAGALKGSAMRLVMGVMADKDVEGILRAYRDGGIFPAEAVCVRPDNPRSMDPSELSRHINLVYNGKVNVKVVESPCEGGEYAYRRSCSDKIPLLVTGSLYLLGQIRSNLKGLI